MADSVVVRSHRRDRLSHVFGMIARWWRSPAPSEETAPPGLEGRSGARLRDLGLEADALRSSVEAAKASHYRHF